MVFATDDAAILINGSQEKALFIPFILDPSGGYVIDGEALLVFSMYISSSKIFEIGKRAIVYDRKETAEFFFRYSARLAEPLERLEQLVLDQVVVQKYITDARKDELEAQKAHSKKALEQIKVGQGPEGLPPPLLDMATFLSQHFKNYEHSVDLDLEDSELQHLDLMSDSKLRKAIAEILVGVDKHQARREAGKSHGPAELADMVVDVRHGDKVYSLCMPFKSGKEIGLKKSVSESVVYQIWRPHMFLANSIVVFITTRPCSQFLLQDIRQSKDRMGWPIAAIERETLARLLKANKQL